MYLLPKSYRSLQLIEFRQEDEHILIQYLIEFRQEDKEKQKGKQQVLKGKGKCHWILDENKMKLKVMNC